MKIAQCLSCSAVTHIRCKGVCWPCYNRRWAAANRDKRRAASRKSAAKHADKIRERSRQYYHKLTATEAGREHRRNVTRNWRRANRDSLLEYMRAWYAAHPDKMREYGRKWEAANAERIAAYRRGWKVENAARIREQEAARYLANREKFLQDNKRWRDENPDKCSIKSARRRARQLGAPVNDLTVAQWEEIKSRYDHRCFYCGQQTKLTKDHKTPLSRGGAHTAANIVPACKPCNSRKHARDFEQFCLTHKPFGTKNTRPHTVQK